MNLGEITITLGIFLAGAVHQLSPADFETSLLINSALLTLGFVIVVVSLYMNQP